MSPFSALSTSSLPLLALQPEQDTAVAVVTKGLPKGLKSDCHRVLLWISVLAHTGLKQAPVSYTCVLEDFKLLSSIFIQLEMTELMSFIR